MRLICICIGSRKPGRHPGSEWAFKPRHSQHVFRAGGGPFDFGAVSFFPDGVQPLEGLRLCNKLAETGPAESPRAGLQFMTESIVEIQDLSFSYNGQSVLQDVNLTLCRGDFVAVIGPNGGGKTTLLKLMLGLLKPDRGSVRVLGEPPLNASSGIGYVPQDLHVNRGFPITVTDIVGMGVRGPKTRRSGGSVRERRRVYAVLDQMGVARYADCRIGELSGGQIQRVLIARALVSRPRLLLLDEPTSSIDTGGQADFYRLLQELNHSVTIVVVSHDLLVISTYVKSVACVNRRLHYHNQAEITEEMLDSMYPCSIEEICPVELVAHGLPHRVLKEHGD